MLEPNRRPYRTRDGYVCVLPYTTRHWHSLFEMVGRNECKEDVRFADFASRREHIDVLYDLLDTCLAERTSAEWLEALEHADIPASPANTIPDLLKDPHLAATGFFRRVEQQDGAFLHMATPARWTGRPFEEPTPAATLAQDTREVLREAGFSDARIAMLKREGATGSAAE